MSASACIVYVGVRYEISTSEVEGLELRTDARQREAKRVGLSTYWANFGEQEDRYLLLIGTEIAILGPETRPWSSVTVDHLNEIIGGTVEALNKAGLLGTCGLHVEWLEDV